MEINPELRKRTFLLQTLCKIPKVWTSLKSRIITTLKNDDSSLPTEKELEAFFAENPESFLAFGLGKFDESSNANDLDKQAVLLLLGQPWQIQMYALVGVDEAW